MHEFITFNDKQKRGFITFNDRQKRVSQVLLLAVVKAMGLYTQEGEARGTKTCRFVVDYLSENFTYDYYSDPCIEEDIVDQLKYFPFNENEELGTVLDILKGRTVHFAGYAQIVMPMLIDFVINMNHVYHQSGLSNILLEKDFVDYALPGLMKDFIIRVKDVATRVYGQESPIPDCIGMINCFTMQKISGFRYNEELPLVIYRLLSFPKDSVYDKFRYVEAIRNCGSTGRCYAEHMTKGSIPNDNTAMFKFDSNSVFEEFPPMLHKVVQDRRKRARQAVRDSGESQPTCVECRIAWIIQHWKTLGALNADAIDRAFLRSLTRNDQPLPVVIQDVLSHVDDRMLKIIIHSYLKPCPPASLNLKRLELLLGGVKRGYAEKRREDSVLKKTDEDRVVAILGGDACFAYALLNSSSTLRKLLFEDDRARPAFFQNASVFMECSPLYPRLLDHLLQVCQPSTFLLQLEWLRVNVLMLTGFFQKTMFGHISGLILKYGVSEQLEITVLNLAALILLATCCDPGSPKLRLAVIAGSVADKTTHPGSDNLPYCLALIKKKPVSFFKRRDIPSPKNGATPKENAKTAVRSLLSDTP